MIVLQELSGDIRDSVAATLDDRYPHSYVVGTVGVWSRRQLSDGQRLDLGLGWKRRPERRRRDPARPDDDRRGAHRLVPPRRTRGSRPDARATSPATLAETKAKRLVVIGDFNASTDDHVLVPVMDQARAGAHHRFGFAFTWRPAAPFVTLDHALVRGIYAASAHVLDANGSDHRGIALTIGR